METVLKSLSFEIRIIYERKVVGETNYHISTLRISTNPICQYVSDSL